MRTIGEIIKTERKKAGFTQQELADLAGFNVNSIRKWESGKASPKFDSVEKISACLGENLFGLFVEEFEHEIFNPVPAHKGRKVAMVKRIRP